MEAIFICLVMLQRDKQVSCWFNSDLHRVNLPKYSHPGCPSHPYCLIHAATAQKSCKTCQKLNYVLCFKEIFTFVAVAIRSLSCSRINGFKTKIPLVQLLKIAF